jgi:hypothetical protein
MIAKKVRNPKKSGSKAERAGGLADYITAPERENGLEKCIHSEARNFLTEKYEAQKLEMIALSQEGVKSADPIDHWVLSWRSDEHPTPEQARQAVEIFIAHCGLNGHQYIWGLHDDTKNKHVHIEVNRVNPDTLKVMKINKGFDREASQQAIALIEHAQGWKQEAGARYDIENGKPVKREKDPIKQLEPSNRAKVMELQTGEKSIERIAQETAAPIIASAKNWKQLHDELAEIGMRYEREGSGAKVYIGDIGIKASDVDRKASFSAMQKRLGPYQPEHEINKNDYHDTSRNFTNANAKKPHTFKIEKDAGHGLRNLSQCTLAHSQKSKQAGRAGVLQLDARPDRRATGGLRRDTGRDNSTGLSPQPIRPGQPGWKEYIVIRDTQKAAKNHDTIELQKRHGTERAALAVKLKGERNEILSGSWKGKGDLRNAMQSVLATQQAAAKLELSDRQGAERKGLQAQYKPLPMYKQWREQPLIVCEAVRPLIDQHITRDRQPPALVQTLKSLSHTIDKRGHVTYQQNGKDMFRDEGRTIQILNLKSDPGLAAALATAQQKYGNNLTLTGSPEFKQRAVAVAVANNLTCKFADPALDELRERLQIEKHQAERAATRAAAERLAAAEKAAADRAAELKTAKALAPALGVAVIKIGEEVDAAGLTPAQRAIVMARVQENVLKAAEKPSHLTASDRALVQRMDKAIESGDKAELKACYGKLDEVEDQAKRATWSNQSFPFIQDRVAGAIQRDTRERLKSDMDKEATDRGEALPWGSGMRIDATYEGRQKAAAEDLASHQRTPRPEGIFKKPEGRDWDSRLQAHETSKAGWDVAVQQRDADIAKRILAAGPSNAARLERERKEHGDKIAQEAPGRERNLGRYEGIKAERARQHVELERNFGKDYEKKITPSKGLER